MELTTKDNQGGSKLMGTMAEDDDFDDDSEPDFDYNDPDETNKRYDRRLPALYTL